MVGITLKVVQLIRAEIPVMDDAVQRMLAQVDLLHERDVSVRCDTFAELLEAVPALHLVVVWRYDFKLMREGTVADVVEESCPNKEVESQSRVELRRLATERRASYRVLEKTSCVAVMPVGARCRQCPKGGAQISVVDDREPARVVRLLNPAGSVRLRASRCPAA